MAKRQTCFVCNNCGSRQLKWSGRCPDCGEWNSLTEEQTQPFSDDLHRPEAVLDTSEPIELTNIDDVSAEDGERWPSGIAELDRVLGGGLVRGATVLLGGMPGIGKSTLLLHLAGAMGKTGRNVMYITSEESLGQIRLRAERLGIGKKSVWIDAQTNLEVIINHIRKMQPAVVVVDSIQMVYKPNVPAAPGSVSQLRQCGTELVWLAKSLGVAVILVGHVTKQGIIAGPRILEHIVDVVLHFEGDRYYAHRLIRAVKNRFGSTNELAIFEMTDTGLIEVADPLAIFLQQDYPVRPGRVILAASEGSRILLVEVQALTAPSIPGMVRRKATAVSSRRLAMIVAVLERHGHVKLGNRDVFVNVVGGVKVSEPAADLAIAAAIAGAEWDKQLPDDVAVFGELGLLGEIRPVPFADQRIAEVQRHGFNGVVTADMKLKLSKRKGFNIHRCRHLQDVLNLLQ